ncbi:MAG TPA: quinoprotein dehydrogenase-associated putative ABC transporter substrate-binding protein [Terriglobales bacterium]|nr:quinoprotein dehydrogenase-associated putative ABC transporter substrate-binding protein [Terriglobales bacterium]
MSSAFRVVAFTVALFAADLAWASPPDLWVCADGNNLPYSNSQGQGFENRLAEMVAHDLGRNLKYVWWPASPTLAHKIFRRGACDTVMGVPSNGDELVTATQPYYRSSYVFVSRRDRNVGVDSFDDPSLHTLRIGLHVVDDGFTPAAQELALRGITHNIVAYSIFGNLGRQNPSAELIRAVARGDVDVSIAWGPLAGYFAHQSSVPLKLTPICAASLRTALPVEFAISMGVRRGESDLLQQLNSEIAQRRSQIHDLLVSYGVPLLPSDPTPSTCK